MTTTGSFPPPDNLGELGNDDPDDTDLLQPDTEPDPSSLSKNAQKRILKEVRRAEKKVERKAKDKALKKEKQRMKAEKRAAGEALDEGEERGKKRALVQRQPFDARVVIDLGFDDKMHERVSSECDAFESPAFH